MRQSAFNGYHGQYYNICYFTYMFGWYPVAVPKDWYRKYEKNNDLSPIIELKGVRYRIKHIIAYSTYAYLYSINEKMD